MHHTFDEKENEELERQAESRPLGQEAIPCSMGGNAVERRPAPLYVGGHFRRNRAVSKDALFHHSSSGASESGGGLGDAAAAASGVGGDVEMVAQQKSPGSVGGEDGFSDLGEDDGFMDETSVVSHRLFRDPEMVDLPDLTSSSKVAIPVSLQRTSSGNFSIE